MSEAVGRATVGQDSPPWGLVLAYGGVSLGLGIVLAVWPGETLTVVAWLIALQLLIGGATQLFLALVPTGLPALGRVLAGVAGLLAIVVGMLCLFSRFQTLELISILFGIWLTVAGAAELVLAFLDSGATRRAWDVVRGVLCVLAGAFLVVNPERSLRLLVLVVCLWLIGFGVVTIVSALRHRRRGVPGGAHRDVLVPGEG